MRSEKSFVTGIASILSSKFFVIIVSILSTPILARLLGADGYGKFATASSIAVISIMVANGGIEDGLRRYISVNKEDQSSRSSVLGFFIRYSLVASIFISSILLSLSFLSIPEGVFGEGFNLFFILIALMIPGDQILTLIRSAMMGLDLEHYSEPLRVLRHFVFFLCGIGLVYLGNGVIGALIGRIAAFWVSGIVGIFILFRYFSLNRTIVHYNSPNKQKEMVYYNIGSFLFLLLNMSLLHADILMIQWLSDSSSTGHYKAGLKIAEFLWFIPGAIQAVVLQSTSKLWVEDDIEKLTSLSNRVSKYTLMVSVLMAAGLFALAEPFIRIYYGEPYLPAVVPLLILLPGTIGYALAKPIYGITQGNGEYRYLILASGIVAIMNIILNLIFIRRFEIEGAAVATSISYGSMLLLHWIVARHYNLHPLKKVKSLRIVLCGFITATTLWWIVESIDSNILEFIIVPPSGAILFSLLLFTLNCLDDDDIRLFKRVILN